MKSDDKEIKWKRKKISEKKGVRLRGWGGGGGGWRGSCGGIQARVQGGGEIEKQKKKKKKRLSDFGPPLLRIPGHAPGICKHILGVKIFFK